MAASSSSRRSEPSPGPGPVVFDGIVRYTLSANEYRALRKLVSERAPEAVRRRIPERSRQERAYGSKDDFNAAAIRHTMRLFLATQTGLKLWDVVKAAIAQRRTGKKVAIPANSSNLRLSLSLSALLFLHRHFYRFLTRLRLHLLTNEAQPFRKRNPRVARALTARLAPALGASLAGFTLAAYPADQFRLTVAIYFSTRAAEFMWNMLEEDGWFEGRPSWFGSWLLMPPIFGELLYAFLFEKDCFPTPYGQVIMRYSQNYLQTRPEDYPTHLPWPDTDQIVGGLAEISRLRYPKFTSPILFPDMERTLPSTVAQLAPITDPAHPAIQKLTCAVLHPGETSCARTYIKYLLQAIPSFFKLFGAIFTLFSLPKYRAFLKQPASSLNNLFSRIIRASVYCSGAIGTAWASICFFQNILPRGSLIRGRWFWGGFLGGFWAYLMRTDGRGQFLYSLRSALDSTYKVGVKKGWWREGKNRDVLVFVAGLMAMNAVFERSPEAIDSGALRKAFGFLRGEGRKLEEEKKRS